MSPFGVSPFKVIALCGQTGIQAPQPMHNDESITTFLLSPTIIARAEVMRRTKTYAVIEVRAYDGDRTLCALGMHILE